MKRAALAATLAMSIVATLVLEVVGPSRLSTAAAQGGVVTGQVVWCAPLPFPIGAREGAVEGAEPLAPEVAPQLAPEMQAPEIEIQERVPQIDGVPIRWRPYPRPIPAGAVLVAVQGTSLSARTDERGMFRIEGVPAGQYLMVAAGPAAGIPNAVALRPNVLIQQAGQTVSVGRLGLSQQCPYFGPLPLGPETEGAVEPQRARTMEGAAEPQRAPVELPGEAEVEGSPFEP